jgi:hypothetical protein
MQFFTALIIATIAAVECQIFCVNPFFGFNHFLPNGR